MTAPEPAGVCCRAATAPIQDGPPPGLRSSASLSTFDPEDNKRIQRARTKKAVFAALDRIADGPNVVQITMAVATLGRTKGKNYPGWQSAVQLLRAAKAEYGVEPNDFTYTAAINACEKSGRWEEVRIAGVSADQSAGHHATSYRSTTFPTAR